MSSQEISPDARLIFNLFEVKNGRNDDVGWEEKEEEVRKAEQEQVEDLKELVNLKLPGAFMGTSLGLQKVMCSTTSSN